MTEVLLRFAHISDTHITPGDSTERNFANYSPAVLAMIEESAKLRTESPPPPPAQPSSVAAKTLVSQVNNLPFDLDFVLHTGDVMTDPKQPADYEAVNALFRDFRFPVYYLRGNHDDLEGIQTVLQKRAPAQPTFDYVVEHNGVVLACVDSATHGMDHGGGLSAEQLTWLESLCTAADDRPLVVAIHHPVLKFGNRFLDFFGTRNGDDVHTVLLKAGKRLRGVFSGHIHQAIDIYKDNILYSFAPNNNVSSNLWPGVAQLVYRKGALLELQPGFSVVTVTTELTFVRRYSYPLTAEA